MRIQDIIIGLMVFAAVGLTIFSFTAVLYSSDNLNVTMDSYTQTQFDLINGNLSTTQSESNTISGVMQSYSPGGANQTLSGDTLTAGDLSTAAWKSLMQMPKVLGLFTNVVGLVGNTVGIDATIMGFILGAILISVILTIVGISFYREVM